MKMESMKGLEGSRSRFKRRTRRLEVRHLDHLGATVLGTSIMKVCQSTRASFQRANSKGMEGELTAMDIM